MKDVVEYGLFFVSVTLQDIGKFGVITTVLPNVQIAMCNVQGLNFLLLMVKLFIMNFLLLKVTVLRSFQTLVTLYPKIQRRIFRD
jgi:hypothetical protein